MKNIIALLLMVFLAPAYAKDFKPSLILESIEAKKLNEKSGDEVYINVTESSAKGKLTSTNIPDIRFAWKSKDLPKIKQVQLWTDTVPDSKITDLIITFAEQDHPPFDPDDLLGAVQLKIVNTVTGLKPIWSVKEGVFKKHAQTVSKGNQQEFILKGSHAEYRVILKIEP